MWKAFAAFLEAETGEPVEVPQLKKAVTRFFEDRAARRVVESGGDPLYDSIFEDTTDESTITVEPGVPAD